jgi:hypothetical protein
MMIAVTRFSQGCAVADWTIRRRLLAVPTSARK